MKEEFFCSLYKIDYGENPKLKFYKQNNIEFFLASDREDLSWFFLGDCTAFKVDARNEIERIRRKYVKRSEKRAAQFAEIVRRLQKRPDLIDSDELILFLIAYASERQYARRVERDAKLVAANANTSNAPITPISRQHITKFALSHSTTPSSSNSRQSLFSSKHVRLLTPQPFALTGRAAQLSVVCEEELTRHMLMALQGIEGTYIICRGDKHSELQLSDMLAVDDTVRVQLLRLLPIANAYLQLRHESQKPTSDRLARAFSTGLSEVLASYMGLISMLYTKYMSNPRLFTCLDILVALSNWEMLLPLFLKVVCVFERLKGMQIFNMLCSLYWSTANQFVQQFLYALLRPMLYIFHDCLHNWLVYGRLMDPGFQWMIELRNKWAMEKNWSKEYSIMDNAVPIIFQQFEGLKEKIFVVGKTVALLELMGMEDDDLHERQRILSSVDPLKCYLYISAGHRLWHAVTKLSHRMSGKVSQNIVRKYNFHAHILAVERHYLLNDEHFALTFYEMLKKEASDNCDMLKLDSQQVSQAFSATIQQCKSWPRDILKQAHIEATCGLMEEFNEAGDSSYLVASPRDQCGCATIRLNYESKIPISVVLNESAMERYEKAFEFIWLLISTDFQLTATLQDHHCFMKSEPLSDATLIVNIFTVSFARMSQILSIIRSYVSHNIVLNLRAAFFLEIDNICGDLDAIIEAHNRYLRQLEEGLFLNEESTTLRNLFCVVFSLITNLLKHYAAFRSEMIDTIEARKRFSKQQKDLTGKNFHDTKFFEQEEERIRLEELQQHLEEYYQPKVKTLNSKFVLLIRDILNILMAPPRNMHYVELALQLDLTNFYRHCDI
uniref:Gamma-tubulin complex component n=1 Tax=Onchocerca volvulus TaxID=6282 RepID=A0A8R1Y343_ONCVO